MFVQDSHQQVLQVSIGHFLHFAYLGIVLVIGGGILIRTSISGMVR
jgi:hypothetical protein